MVTKWTEILQSSKATVKKINLLSAIYSLCCPSPERCSGSIREAMAEGEFLNEVISIACTPVCDQKLTMLRCTAYAVVGIACGFEVKNGAIAASSDLFASTAIVLSGFGFPSLKYLAIKNCLKALEFSLQLIK